MTQPTALTAAPIRVVLAKIGLDGHDRGIQVVARALRDAGMEVIYTGLWQTPEAVVRAVEDEDADVVGISLLSGCALDLGAGIDRLRCAGGQRVLVIVGGIIPAADIPKLEAMGVGKVFTPGAGLTEIATFIRGAVPRPGVSAGP